MLNQEKWKLKHAEHDQATSRVGFNAVIFPLELILCDFIDAFFLYLLFNFH